jgi:hypothetical protein
MAVGPREESSVATEQFYEPVVAHDEAGTYVKVANGRF